MSALNVEKSVSFWVSELSSANALHPTGFDIDALHDLIEKVTVFIKSSAAGGDKNGGSVFGSMTPKINSLYARYASVLSSHCGEFKTALKYANLAATTGGEGEDDECRILRDVLVRQVEGTKWEQVRVPWTRIEVGSGVQQQPVVQQQQPVMQQQQQRPMNGQMGMMGGMQQQPQFGMQPQQGMQQQQPQQMQPQQGMQQQQPQQMMNNNMQQQRPMGGQMGMQGGMGMQQQQQPQYGMQPQQGMQQMGGGGMNNMGMNNFGQAPMGMGGVGQQQQQQQNNQFNSLGGIGSF